MLVWTFADLIKDYGTLLGNELTLRFPDADWLTEKVSQKIQLLIDLP